MSRTRCFVSLIAIASLSILLSETLASPPGHTQTGAQLKGAPGPGNSSSPGGQVGGRYSSESFALRQAPPNGAPGAPEGAGRDDDDDNGDDDDEYGGYKEISGFFNVREANANVEHGEWEFELTNEWVTRSDGTDDDFTLEPSVKYGITDDLYVELEVPAINFGDGDNVGNGDVELQVFYQFLHEDDCCPAAAVWADMRIPSGDGSSGVDASLHFSLTKTLVPKFRAHFAGFIETANGARGGEEADDRRNFQWGVGPGFDYEFDEKTMGVVNYLMRSSEEEGNHNQNILEVGITRELVPGQHLKVAVDVGLDGAEETPNFGAKLQWSLELKP